jgi:hypothetical protein
MNQASDNKEQILREQCENLSSCLDQLTKIIDREPGRRDLYLLQTLLEETLSSIHRNYNFSGGFAKSAGSKLRRIW